MTLVSPPKRKRSQKQIEWSKQLGQKSKEFKRQKNLRLQGHKTLPGNISENIDNDNIDNAKIDNVSEAEIENNETGNNFSSWLVIVTVVGVVCLFWCKCGKYKAFSCFKPKPLQDRETPAHLNSGNCPQHVIPNKRFEALCPNPGDLQCF